ncbi:MAG: hypothetical protein ACRCZD_01190, partial [Phycicoccus sp.]
MIGGGATHRGSGVVVLLDVGAGEPGAPAVQAGDGRSSRTRTTVLLPPWEGLATAALGVIAAVTETPRTTPATRRTTAGL